MYVGVWSQPKGSLAKWKARGVNVLIASEPENNAQGVATVPQAEWRAAARAVGLPYYDRPSASPEADAADPFLLGFLMDDEPDRRIVLPAVNALKTEKDFAKRVALLKRIDDYVAFYRVVADRCRATGRPVLGNFSGPDITGAPGAYKGDGQKPFLPLVTEIGADWYVNNKDLTRYPNTLVGDQLDLLVRWNRELGQPDKPLWLFLECSNQRISKTGGAPSDSDVEEHVAIAVARGAKGVIWFPQAFGPFQYDALTDAQAAKVAEVSKRLAGPLPAPVPAVDPELVAARARIAELEADRDRKAATLQRVRDLLAEAAAPTPQPTTGGN